MLKKAPENDTLITVSEASQMLGVSTITLYRYEKKGLLAPLRTAGGHRRYSLMQVTKFKEKMKSEDFIHNRHNKMPLKEAFK